MKILMLSWEYPPKNIGGISNHVYNLARHLKDKGIEIHVVTCEAGTTPVIQNDDGIIIHRVAPYRIESDDFVKWVMQLNFAMIEESNKLINKYGRFDIIHAHDWLTAFAGKVLKWSYKIPLVSTIHGTEYGRNNGIRTEMQKYISSTELMLTNESWKLVVCSHYMRQHLSDIFKAHWDKMWVIPNGVNKEDFQFEFDKEGYRAKFASEDEKILFYVGRHVFEKGIHILIEAIPKIAKSFNNIKVVIGGTGPMTEELISRANEIGVGGKIIFAGYMNELDRNKMYKAADAAVFPSLYEPFGIVALEAMAAGCPVVASGSGGLGEIISHKYNGMKTIPGSVDSLSYNIIELLNDNKLSESIRQNAYRSISDQYSWDRAADLTIKMYNLIKQEAFGTEWDSQDLIVKESGITDSEMPKIEDLITIGNIEPIKKKSTAKGRKTKSDKDQTSERETAVDSQNEVIDSQTDVKQQKKKRTSTRKTKQI